MEVLTKGVNHNFFCALVVEFKNEEYTINLTNIEKSQILNALSSFDLNKIYVQDFLGLESIVNSILEYFKNKSFEECLDYALDVVNLFQEYGDLFIAVYDEENCLNAVKKIFREYQYSGYCENLGTFAKIKLLSRYTLPEIAIKHINWEKLAIDFLKTEDGSYLFYRDYEGDGYYIMIKN
jgi:hypothetical protein